MVIQPRAKLAPIKQIRTITLTRKMGDFTLLPPEKCPQSQQLSASERAMDVPRHPQSSNLLLAIAFQWRGLQLRSSKAASNDDRHGESW